MNLQCGIVPLLRFTMKPKAPDKMTKAGNPLTAHNSTKFMYLLSFLDAKSTVITLIKDRRGRCCEKI